MAETIKGINVVIGADTTSLASALSDVNKRSRDIQSELKQVEKLLRLDPTNTELLAQKQRLLSDAVGNTREKLDRLRAAQQQVSEQFARGDITEGQYRAFQREVISTEQELQRLEGRLEDVTDEIEDQGGAASRLGREYQEAFEEAQQQLGNTFEKAKKIGTALTAAGAAIALALGDATKSAADFEQGLANAYSVMDPAEVSEFKGELKDLALTMGADTKYSATEAAKGIEELIKAGVSVSDVMGGGLQGALSLATAGELELADAAEVASTVLNAFRDDNISVAQAADILAGAANASATSVSEMKFGLSQSSAVASAVGLSFQDTATALAAFAQNGLKGSDAGTSLKTMLMRLQPSTKEQLEQFFDLGLMVSEAGKAMEVLRDNGIQPLGTDTETLNGQLKKLAADLTGTKLGSAKANAEYIKLAQSTGVLHSAFYDASGSLKGMDEIAQILQTSLKDMNDAQRQAALQVMFGSDAIRAGSILYKEGAAGINSMADAMGKISAEDVAAQKMDTLKGSIELLSGALETAKISIGDVFIPIIRQAADMVSGLVDKFNDLSPGMKKATAIAAAVAAGIGLIAGPALLLVGFLPQIAAGLSMVGVTAGSLGAALTVLTGPVGLIVAGIAALTVGGIALYKHLQKDSIPEIQRFGNEVSESTQKAVGGFLDLNDKATVALNELHWSGQTITSQTATSIKETFAQMGDQVTAAMQEDHAEQLQTMTDFFKNSAALTDEEEAAALEKMKTNFTTQEGYVQESQRKIAVIMDKAAEEKRGITDKERAEINRLQEQMVETGIKVLSENELEQKAIMERMRQNAGELSARQAAEVVQNSAKQRDEAVKAANEQYDETIKAIIKQRDETGSITAEQADKLIAEATRQRDNTVSQANGMFTDVVSAAKKQAGEHINQVDWETGEILSKWEVFKNRTSEKWDSIKADTKKKWNEVYGAISEKAGEISDNISETWNNIINFLKNINLKQIGKDIMQGLLDGIKDMAGSISDSVKNIGNSIKDGVKNVLDIHSPSRVMRTLGQFTGEGMALGMKDSVAAVKQQASALANAAQPSKLTAGGAAVGTSTTINLDGMMSGANFYVRSDNDIKSIALEMFNMANGSSRGAGGVRG